MDSFFIDPSALPGVQRWNTSCQALPKSAAHLSPQEYHDLLEAIGCNASTLGGFVQALTLLAVYSAILFYASNLIAKGSELLLLIDGLRSILGSVVLPILGVSPDGTIVFFSALGSNARKEISVDVGALVGSTIMLLIVSWFFAVYAGRVNIRRDVTPQYAQPPGNRLWHNKLSLRYTGVESKPVVRETSRYMAITSILYVIIQGIALSTGNFVSAQQPPGIIPATAKQEHYPAIFVLICCGILFVHYLYTQLNVSDDVKDNRATIMDHVIADKIQGSTISLSTAFWELPNLVQSQMDETSPLTPTSSIPDVQKRLDHVLEYFFKEYDGDKMDTLNARCLAHLMSDVNERMSKEELENLLCTLDEDRNVKSRGQNLGKRFQNSLLHASHTPRSMYHRLDQRSLE